MRCLYEKAVVTQGRRIPVRRFPQGCSGNPIFEETEERRPHRVELVDGFCVVDRKYIMPRKACGVVEEAAEGRLRRILAAGPPGTGKSTLLKLVRDVAPVNIVYFKPEELLSRYVGETEQKFKSMLQDAVDNQPSAVLVDEADMLLSPRSGAGSDAMQEVRANLVRIFLSWLQDIEGENVGVLLTTNMSLREMDSAVFRAGRFDEILFFPPPDADSATLLAKLMGKTLDRQEAARIARLAGSWSNLVEYLETGRLRPYRPSPYAEIISGDCSKVKKVFEVTSSARVVVLEDPPLGYLVSLALSCMGGYGTVVAALDPRRVEDALALASSMEAPVAIPYSALAENSSWMQHSHPVFLVGQGWRVSLPRIDSQLLASRIGWASIASVAGLRARTRDELVKRLGGVRY